LKAVAAQTGRICVLKCGANEREREKEKGGRCVANAKPERVTSKIREERPRATKNEVGPAKPFRQGTVSGTVSACRGVAGEIPANGFSMTTPEPNQGASTELCGKYGRPMLPSKVLGVLLKVAVEELRGSDLRQPRHL
jgi:hypothetical protein